MIVCKRTPRRGSNQYQDTRTPHIPRVLPGVTFEGRPFNVELSSDCALDHGASAAIYKGVLRRTWSHPLVVAVKVFDQFLQPVQQELLVRELRITSQASLRHPRILTFLGTADLEGQKSLVSLYMSNGNLLNYVKSHRGRDKKRLILQVAEAVNYLHTGVCIVHGDLKCANVLVNKSGDALLADFGLSTFEETSEVATTMTMIREMHTIRFAAPELLDDTTLRAVFKTRQSDVYAFGMLVLEAITERPPWSNKSTSAVILEVCNGERPPQPRLQGWVSVSHAWWNVCRDCWTLAPRDRPRMDTVLCRLRENELDPHRQIASHVGHVLFTGYSLGGHRVISGSSDGSIRVWDTLTRRIARGLMLRYDGVFRCAAVSPDGLQLCAGGNDMIIHRWSAESGAAVGHPLSGHTGHVTCIRYSPDSKWIVSGGNDRTVRLWDAITGTVLRGPLKGHEKPVCSVEFSPCGACIASGSMDGTINLWDSATGSLSATLQSGSAVLSLCFSPNLVQLLSSSANGTIQIWNLRALKLQCEITAHSDPVRSVAVSQCARYIVSASNDHTIRVWDIVTVEEVGEPLVGHTGGVMSVSFSPDGKSLVSGAWDGTVRIWDIFE